MCQNDLTSVLEWIKENAERYWLCDGGPLRKSSEGGAHIIMVDDPQMPIVIAIAKEQEPERPVIFRSHIQIRSDLIEIEGSPQQELWYWLWQFIGKADLFICHPVPSFVPTCVPREIVGFMPATTDW